MPEHQTTENLILYLHEQAMKTKNPHEKAMYVFCKLMLSAYDHAIEETEKILKDKRIPVLLAPMWLGKLYSASALPHVIEGKEHETMAQAAITFQDTVMSSAGAREEELQKVSKDFADWEKQHGNA